LDKAISGTAKLSITDASGVANLLAEAESKPRPKTPKTSVDESKRRISVKPDQLASGSSKRSSMAAVKPPLKSQESVLI
jgi:hypothetical protein